MLQENANGKGDCDGDVEDDDSLHTIVVPNHWIFSQRKERIRIWAPSSVGSSPPRRTSHQINICSYATL
jgi:hypothetical protein